MTTTSEKPAGGTLASPVDFLGDSLEGGLRKRPFVVSGSSGPIPGILWTPTGEAPEKPSRTPLVLLGHGASGSKLEGYVRRLGERLASCDGLAAAAIDGPVHGERRPDKGRDGTRVMLDFATAWSSDDSLTDRMVEDWRCTLDALLGLEELSGPVGYFGLSMGTILGLPFVAADRRVEAAVLGLMGMTGPTEERIRRAAPKVTCPVLFLLQWADELFPRELAFELFAALGSVEKTMHANPGPHGAVPAFEFAAIRGFFSRHLSGSGR
jgi:dienelactone hydrolase